MNIDKLYNGLKLLVANMVSILFLLGLIMVNVSTYLGFGTIVGMINTGVFLILIALIIDFEAKGGR